MGLVRSYCYGKATGQQWCAFTSTNIGIRQQKAGKGLPVEEGKDLVITCEYFGLKNHQQAREFSAPRANSNR